MKRNIGTVSDFFTKLAMFGYNLDEIIQMSKQRKVKIQGDREIMSTPGKRWNRRNGTKLSVKL